MRLDLSPTRWAVFTALAVVTLAACADDQVTAPVAAPPAAPSLAGAGSSAAPPELPRATVNTDLVAPTGRTISVAAGASLQSAISSAVPGDVIVLAAGATFTGNFYLPKKTTGSGWITIRTSTPDNLLPPGVRVSPAQSALLAKLVSPNADPALRTSVGAHHYRLIGLDLAAAPSVSVSVGLLNLGSGSSSTQSTLAQTPSYLIVDRSYIHGHATLDVKNCIALNSAHTAVIDSYLAGCHSNTQESHAINGYNGPGPFKIENNYIEAGDINIFFGGASPAAQELVPADITVRRNHVTRPLSWKGVWTVKTLVEFKFGRRVLFEGNVFENNWVAQQKGFAFNFKTDVGSRAAPWANTEDITFRYNLVRNVAAGVTLSLGSQSYHLPTRRFRFEHNVWENVGVSNGTNGGRVFQVLHDVAGVQIEHNTVFHASFADALVRFENRGVDTNFVFRDNLATRGTGVQGDYVTEGKPALDRYAPGYVFATNAIVGAAASRYPTGNYFPATLADVGFVNHAGRNFRLAPTSPYKGRASDGTDVGADVDRVSALVTGVVRP